MKRAGKYWVPDVDTHFTPIFERGDEFQLDRLEIALDYVKDFNTALDCGAHVGTWSLRMATEFNAVYAFEPNPETFACLDRNTAIRNNIFALNVAVGDKAGFVTMQVDDTRGAGNTGAYYIQPVNGVNGGLHNVRMMTIDGLGFLQGVGFIKLDVEGAELLALRGAIQTIKANKPVIFLEAKKGMGERFGCKLDAPMKYLEALGAKCVKQIVNDYIFVF